MTNDEKRKYFIETLERIHNAITGTTTREEKDINILALISATATILGASNGIMYNEELYLKIKKRIIEVNLNEPIKWQPLNDELYNEIYSKIRELIGERQELFTILYAIAGITATTLYLYKTGDTQINVNHLGEILNRILDVNTN